MQALTATVVYEVGQAALGTLMRDRPSIADEISVTLSRRMKVGRAGPVTATRTARGRSPGLSAEFASCSRYRTHRDDLSNSGCRSVTDARVAASVGSSNTDCATISAQTGGVFCVSMLVL